MAAGGSPDLLALRSAGSAGTGGPAKRKRRKGPKVLVAHLLVDCLADWMNPGGLAILSAGPAALRSGRPQDARRLPAEAAQAVPGDAPV